MATQASHAPWAARLGRAAGRAWRSYLRGERRAVEWLASRGLSAGIARALLWVVKLVVLGVLLYTALWLALLLLFVVAAGRVAEHSVPAREDEWPFQSLDELRKTPGYDPVLYNDFSHSDYPDEKDD